MFTGHLPELIVLLLAALVIFGPKRLPEIGGAMGKGIKEFRRGTTEPDEDTSKGQGPAPEKPAQISTAPEAHAPAERDVVHASTKSDHESH